MLELHFAVPMTGAVLNTINTRLDAKTIATILGHGESQMLFVEREYADVAEAALDVRPQNQVIGIDDPAVDIGRMIGGTDYETFLASGNVEAPLFDLRDETMPISLSYTSGTTGNKGVVYSHRGAALNALGNVLAIGLTSSSTYLWTLPFSLRRMDPSLVSNIGWWNACLHEGDRPC